MESMNGHVHRFFATLLLWLLVTLVPCTLPLLLLELGKDLRSRWDAVPNMSRFGWVFTVAAAMEVMMR